MPASWSTFVNNVADKLESKSLKNNQDLANYITDQYVSATVGKAQTPFGNTHIKGRTSIMSNAFKSGLDELLNRPSPTFEERERDPKFSDFTASLPQSPTGGYNIEQEYLKWAEENPDLAPNFLFFPLFQDSSSISKDKNKSVKLLAERVFFQYDGTPQFLEWVETIPKTLGNFGELVYKEFINIVTKSEKKLEVGVEASGNAIYKDINFNYNEIKKIQDNFINDDTSRNVNSRTGDKSVKITGIISKIITNPSTGSNRYFISFQQERAGRLLTINKEVFSETIRIKVTPDEIITKKSRLSFQKKLFQLTYSYDNKNLPSWVDESVIVKLTYIPGIDRGYDSEVFDAFGLRKDKVSAYRENLSKSVSRKKALYGNAFSGEVKKWFDSLIVWGNFEAGKAKQESVSETGDQNDPYEIMAKGVLGYWISTTSTPFTAAPPVPPCGIPTPGTYVGLFYGNQKSLADNLRRSFNSGKLLKVPGTDRQASRIVATALSISFAIHLSELKFLYNGSIPTPGGPVPMIGFIPTVF